MAQRWTRTGGNTHRVMVGDMDAYDLDCSLRQTVLNYLLQSRVSDLAVRSAQQAQETTAQQEAMHQNYCAAVNAALSAQVGCGSLPGGYSGGWDEDRHGDGERELTRYAALSDSHLVEYLSLGGSKAFADKGLSLVGAMRKIGPIQAQKILDRAKANGWQSR